MTDPDYDNIKLTEEEEKAALFEGKRKKWFKEKNKDKWPEDPYEKKKPFTVPTNSPEKRWP